MGRSRALKTSGHLALSDTALARAHESVPNEIATALRETMLAFRKHIGHRHRSPHQNCEHGIGHILVTICFILAPLLVIAKATVQYQGALQKAALTDAKGRARAHETSTHLTLTHEVSAPFFGLHT